MLAGKKILLGITASIAAYKAIYLVRLLTKLGAEVKVVATPASLEFVPLLTLSTLSKNAVLTQLADEASWANHVMLGRWADVMLIAPLSCNTLAKMTAGMCDNLLMATYLSSVCPVVIAPAMDEDMWHHPTTRRNLQRIENDGVSVIPVAKGELASGLYGDGRMAEPEDIIKYLIEKFFRTDNLKGKKALVNAGPTFEPMDPVRFIGNRSSGKMGIAIAEALYLSGAEVTLVLGPSVLEPQFEGIQITKVNTADEMLQACRAVFTTVDMAVFSAAIADYTPVTVATSKIKKREADITINLKKTPDIVATLAASKRPEQLLVGFALETDNEQANALEKLKRKNVDLLVLNSLNDKGAGFGVDTNKITVFDKNGNQNAFDLKSKQEAARDIVDLIIQKIL